MHNQSGLYYHYPSKLLYSNLGQLRSIVLVIMDRIQLALNRICLGFLLNDELLCNQSSLYYHYLSQLLYSNLGKLRSIVLVIMDRAQLVQKRICAGLLLNGEPLRDQSGLCYHYPSQLLCSNLGQLRSIVLAIVDRTQLV